jgi:hypothetical protein
MLRQNQECLVPPICYLDVTFFKDQTKTAIPRSWACAQTDRMKRYGFGDRRKTSRY